MRVDSMKFSEGYGSGSRVLFIRRVISERSHGGIRVIDDFYTGGHDVFPKRFVIF